LNSNGRSDGFIGIRGIKTSFPSAHPVMMVASRTCDIICLIHSRVPLHNFGVPNFRSSITGAPSLRPNYEEALQTVLKNVKTELGTEQPDLPGQQYQLICMIPLDQAADYECVH